MVFNSLTFIVFFACVLAMHSLPLGWTTRKNYPQLRPDVQGYDLPEWSHMTRADGERFTATLYGIIQREFWGPHATAAARSPASDAAAAPSAPR